MNGNGELIKETNGDKTTYRIRRRCIECGKTFISPPFTKEQYDKYTGGAHVQDAFNEWTASERELFLMSGLCGDCFDRLMSWGDEED